MEPHEIKEFRLKKNLTQTQLGEMCGVGKSSVVAWEKEPTEKGSSKPSGPSQLALERYMSGEWAIVPLTAQEERLLDDGVSRAGYDNREDYLLAALTHILRTNTGFSIPTKRDSLTEAQERLMKKPREEDGTQSQAG